ncbi:hypothetical protein [Micromonospora sp. WMMD736]|uniref:hypothetical protein n=1 Tax=Micromonospora sp. WMMD736 TaxID=3404112 RepID=UPI003B92D510
MRITGFRSVASALLVGSVTATGALLGSPAYAATTSCEYTKPDYSCQTGVILPNSTYHALSATAVTYTDNDVTCYVYDKSTQAQVGVVRDTKNGGSTSIVIRGLYGSYWMNCTGPGSSRYGGGSLRNDSYLVD